MSVVTLGHGSRTTEEIVDLLREVGADTLVDVRRHPGSRRHPHVGRHALAKALPPRGITYEWWGESLGGRRSPVQESRHVAWREPAFRAYADHMDTDDFRTALLRLAENAQERPPLAVMCSETLWWRCHRRLIADALVLEGVDVVHLLGPGSRQTHELPTWLRVDDAGRPVYDGPASDQ